jgi:hypothetical protein
MKKLPEWAATALLNNGPSSAWAMCWPWAVQPTPPYLVQPDTGGSSPKPG